MNIQMKVPRHYMYLTNAYFFFSFGLIYHFISYIMGHGGLVVSMLGFQPEGQSFKSGLMLFP